jgi:hypothetical protein
MKYVVAGMLCYLCVIFLVNLILDSQRLTPPVCVTCAAAVFSVMIYSGVKEAYTKGREEATPTKDQCGV